MGILRKILRAFQLWLVGRVILADPDGDPRLRTQALWRIRSKRATGRSRPSWEIRV